LAGVTAVAAVFCALLAANPRSEGGLDAAKNEIAFDIPALPLSEAIERLSAASKLQVVFDFALVSGRISPPLSGTFKPATALELLLKGSGLGTELIAENTISIVKIPLSQDNQLYLRSVQGRLMSSLCHENLARGGHYRMAASFAIDAGGRIVMLKFLSPLQDATRRNAIAAAFMSVVLPPPPDGLPQPVTIILEPKSDDDFNVCQAAP
jgi:type II secretory pathway component GspD/PulD (secretin)